MLRLFRPKLPKTWTPISFERRFTPTEYRLMSAGHISQSMDDHWDIYFREGTLYFHRSWTGLCAYKLRLEREGEEYAVVEAATGIASAVDGPWHCSVLGDVIDCMLLGRPDPFLLALTKP